MTPRAGRCSPRRNGPIRAAGARRRTTRRSSWRENDRTLTTRSASQRRCCSRREAAVSAGTDPAARVAASGHKQRRKHRQPSAPARAQRQVSPRSSRATWHSRKARSRRRSAWASSSEHGRRPGSRNGRQPVVAPRAPAAAGSPRRSASRCTATHVDAVGAPLLGEAKQQRPAECVRRLPRRAWTASSERPTGTAADRSSSERARRRAAARAQEHPPQSPSPKECFATNAIARGLSARSSAMATKRNLATARC